MVRALVNWLLGPWGREVLAFYVAHSLWINGAVVLYGALLTVAHLNLRRIARAADPHRGADGSAPADDAFWTAMIKQASCFPLVAGPRSLIPRRTTPANLRLLDSRPPSQPARRSTKPPKDTP
jgi:hypothetical protein